jgi:hypothetical protein
MLEEPHLWIEGWIEGSSFSIVLVMPVFKLSMSIGGADATT